MPFTLIKGPFHVVGMQPNGDTLRFEANNSDNRKKLSWRRAAIGARGARTYWN